MDHHQEETTSFEVTVTSDVSNSEISSNTPIVLGNTLSWGINECSSSFQSVSSCETLESYEHHTLNTESPKVIVVPFLADNVTDNDISGTVLTNNGVHIPVIKECSIRIDQLKMSSQSHFGEHCDVDNVEKIIELPFNSNCATDRSCKYASYDDDDEFLGFGAELLDGTETERYNKLIKEIRKNNFENLTQSKQTNKVIMRKNRKNDFGNSTERTERIISVKKPRPIHRKMPKAKQLRDNQIQPINQSRIENTEIIFPTNKLNNTNSTMKPVPIPIPDRVSSTPIPDHVSSTPTENEDKREGNKKDTSSDSSDSDSDVTPAVVVVETAANNKQAECSSDARNNNNKRKEIRKMEKMRRRKELSLIAEKIRDNWRETFAAERRKQRKKARKMKMERNKYKTYYTKNDFIEYQYRGQRKKKRVSYSSDSDSSDTSNTSKTSYSTSSSDSSNDSDTTTSYTSQTSHRTDSDSTDSDSSDSRSSRCSRSSRSSRSSRCSKSSRSSSNSRNRHHFNRRRISPPATSDSSYTSSSSEDKYKRRRLLKKDNRKESRTKSNENCLRSPRRKSLSYRPEESHPKKRRLSNVSDSSIDSKRMKNRANLSPKPQYFKKLDSSARSPSSKSRKPKSGYIARPQIESTSAGAFSVKKCCFD